MFEFNIGEEVRITEVTEFEPKIYKVGKVVKVRKRDYKKGFDHEPLYWFGNKKYISQFGLYQSQLEKV